MAMDGEADNRVKPELLRDMLRLINFEPVSEYEERISKAKKAPKQNYA